jgi:hypothetical protein
MASQRSHITHDKGRFLLQRMLRTQVKELLARSPHISHGLRNEMHFPVNWLWTYL